jgi:endonuclease/exonuclease/phosphatase family metal-dependent hydrolase
LLHAFPVLANGNSPVVMGDFNHRPKNNDAELDKMFCASHQMMYEKGYTSPYVNEVGLCTLCKNNFLRKPGKEQSIMDHIYVKSGISVQGVRVRQWVLFYAVVNSVSL